MYFWLKVLHIGAMCVWFAGLFFLPRLLVARHRIESDADAAYFNPVANTLFFRVMTPAALLTTLVGMGLMAWAEPGAWLVLKLMVVTLAVFMHLYFGVLLYELGRGNDRHGAMFYRLVGWLPLLLVTGIAALTAAKPDGTFG
jgi:putative membrane protein